MPPRLLVLVLSLVHGDIGSYLYSSSPPAPLSLSPGRVARLQHLRARLLAKNSFGGPGSAISSSTGATNDLGEPWRNGTRETASKFKPTVRIQRIPPTGGPGGEKPRLPKPLPAK